MPATQQGWDRRMMIGTTRTEIDNIAALIELLDPKAAESVELAASHDLENLRAKYRG